MRMQTVVPALLVLAVAVGMALGQAQPGKEYTPKNKRYTIIMPAGEKTSENVKLIPIPGQKSKIAVEMAQSTLKDGTHFTAASLGLPAVALKGIPEAKRFELFRDVFLKPLNGKIVEEKDFKDGVMAGKDYLIEAPKTVARMRLYMYAGIGLYVIVEAGTKERLKAKDVDDFYGSFKLTGKL